MNPQTQSNTLIIGGAGYISSILAPTLTNNGHNVHIVDRCFFGYNPIPTSPTARQLFGFPPTHEITEPTIHIADTRSISPSLFNNIDCVIDLAGISNDPSCELDPDLTRKINYEATTSTIRLAKNAGVKKYILSSSCSVYGRGHQQGLHESSPINPVSLYAKCKADAESELLAMRAPGFAPTVLRLATVFGLSPRMRFDLAINVMTKNAYTKGQITVDGGGKQWRPFVHVRDVANTMLKIATAETNKVDGEIFNVGHDNNNVRILNLAYRVRDAIPGTHVIMAPTDPDLRDYNVKFDKLHDLFPGQTFTTIESGIEEVLSALKSGLIDPDDRRWYTINQYRFLLDVERTYRDLALDGRLLS